MRVAHAALGGLMLCAAALLIAAGSGRFPASTADAVSPGGSDVIDLPADGASQASRPEREPQARSSAKAQAGQPPPAAPPNSSGHARTIDPETIAPPDVAARELERVSPRAPLSHLSLAQPPKPKPPEALKNQPLYRPVAVAAGLIEAKGNTIAISGVEAVKPEETCTDPSGKAWKCGMRARTAFRAFLRGRAVTCDDAALKAATSDAAHGATVADCKVAKQDVGRWLVENGWARALKTGSYADAGEAARKAGKGIYGAAPDFSGLPPPPPPVEITTPVSPSILDLSGTAATPPVAPPEPAR